MCKTHINLHTGHAAINIACNMKPRAGIDKGRIPALKNIVRILQVVLQCIQCITCAKKNQFQLQTSLILTCDLWSRSSHPRYNVSIYLNTRPTNINETNDNKESIFHKNKPYWKSFIWYNNEVLYNIGCQMQPTTMSRSIIIIIANYNVWSRSLHPSYNVKYSRSLTRTNHIEKPL